MARDRAVFVGPRLRRLRRELGLTQAKMAKELDISASYIALIERNQRPLSADLLLRLAETYDINVTRFAGEGAKGVTDRLNDVLRDPLFADLDIAPGEAGDISMSNPGLAEALLRVHTAYREGQMALADHKDTPNAEAPLEAVRLFLAARRNFFPALDEHAERLAKKCEDRGGMARYLNAEFGFTTRHLPPDVMAGAIRRLDLHRRELTLDDTLDSASRRFQLALQLVYLALDTPIKAALHEGRFSNDNALRIGRRALANYTAAAIVMPYTEFYREAEKRHYDISALSRVFGCSFEQTAHRLTSLQKPGATGVPFFFIRVDAAGNVSKRMDGGGFPFARHGGSCPLWSLHTTFQKPREILTEVLELPDGERFFSIARTVTAGGGTYQTPSITRALALGCSLDHAERLIYTQGTDVKKARSTPIGVACRLCHRAGCSARAEPPIGRQLLLDDDRRMVAPFGFVDQ